MSRLNDLIRQVAASNPKLATDLQREVSALADRRSFGLNFERHVPEAVELPGRPVRKGDKVRRLPERGQMPKKENERLFRVTKTYFGGGAKWADIEALDDSDEGWSALVDDLVVVAEFRDPIYPGLVSTGKVERGGDKPFHTVINAENYHALQTLLYTHRGKIDCIYIDPPYNTGAKDWKYNNDYVEGDDIYRHSKWLAFMERRLLLSKELLNPKGSVLIVTIDEKEYLRLGLLLEQLFPEARQQMATTIIKPEGTNRTNEFSRTNEYVFFVMLGAIEIAANDDNLFDPRRDSSEGLAIEWRNLRRREKTSKRGARPNQFYAVFVSENSGSIHSVGDPLPPEIDRRTIEAPAGTRAVFPLTPDGTEMLWGLVPESLRDLVSQGYAKASKSGIQFLTAGVIKDIENGRITIAGKDEQGAVIGEYSDGAKKLMPKTVWVRDSHNSQTSGTLLLKKLLPARDFPFPKSLYAVEDAIRFFVADKPRAIVLDFFAGSGTTAHAVMRINRQLGGARHSISITNNEVSADEQSFLRERGLRPGDPEWEELGICDHVTNPRIRAAITGMTPDGDPIRGEYKFTDEFPMADGFVENVEFFELTYEAPLRVTSNRDFERIAPLLWMRAGCVGRRIDDMSEGWDVADSYAVIADLDLADAFLDAIRKAQGVTVAFIVTNDDRLFESVARALPESVEPVRLYESYLRNFEIESGRSVR